MVQRAIPAAAAAAAERERGPTASSIRMLENEERRLTLLKEYRRDRQRMEEGQQQQEQQHCHTAEQLIHFYLEYCRCRAVEPLRKLVAQLEVGHRRNGSTTVTATASASVPAIHGASNNDLNDNVELALHTETPSDAGLVRGDAGRIPSGVRGGSPLIGSVLETVIAPVHGYRR